MKTLEAAALMRAAETGGMDGPPPLEGDAGGIDEGVPEAICLG